MGTDLFICKIQKYVFDKLYCYYAQKELSLAVLK